MTGAAVAVEGLAFSYGDRKVLSEVGFEVAPGEVFGIVGADGAGKSTLLRVLIGQLEPAAGSVRVLGQYLDLSVQENLEFFAALHGLVGSEAAALIADLVARAGLRGFEDRRAGQLSGGMMQKLALACALVSRPRVMFLDEPTTGVDPVSRRAFWQLIQAVRADGVAIVWATANMQEAESCDRVATIENGHLLRQGRPADLVRAVEAKLLLVTGEGLRASVGALAATPEVDFAFPVGQQVKLWLKAGADVAALRASLEQRWPGALVEDATPGLHDVALRELALAEREHHHA